MRGTKAERDRAEVRLRNDHLEEETGADRRDERDDERLEQADSRGAGARARPARRAPVMHDADRSGMPNSSLSAMAEPITSARSHAAMAISQPIQSTNDDGARVVVAARLGEVAAGGDAELEREALEQHRHEVGDEHHAEQRVAERARRPRGRWPSCPGPCSRRPPGIRARRTRGPSSTSPGGGPGCCDAPRRARALSASGASRAGPAPARSRRAPVSEGSSREVA